MLDFLRWPLSSIRGIYQAFPSAVKRKDVEIDDFQLNLTTGRVAEWVEKNEQFSLKQGFVDMTVPTPYFENPKLFPTSMYDLFISVPARTLNIGRMKNPAWKEELLWHPFSLPSKHDFGGIGPTTY